MEKIILIGIELAFKVFTEPKNIVERLRVGFETIVNVARSVKGS